MENKSPSIENPDIKNLQYSKNNDTLNSSIKENITEKIKIETPLNNQNELKYEDNNNLNENQNDQENKTLNRKNILEVFHDNQISPQACKLIYPARLRTYDNGLLYGRGLNKDDLHNNLNSLNDTSSYKNSISSVLGGNSSSRYTRRRTISYVGMDDDNDDDDFENDDSENDNDNETENNYNNDNNNTNNIINNNNNYNLNNNNNNDDPNSKYEHLNPQDRTRAILNSNAKFASKTPHEFPIDGIFSSKPTFQIRQNPSKLKKPINLLNDPIINATIHMIEHPISQSQNSSSSKNSQPSDLFEKETLIPIRLNIELGNNSSQHITDFFMWNLKEESITPEKFATIMCTDLDISPQMYVPQIASAIRTQIEEYAPLASIELPPDSDLRAIISVSVNVAQYLFQDKFEWDLSSTVPPETFAKIVVSDLGLAGEFYPAISHAIHESILKMKKDACEGQLPSTVNNLAAFGAEAGWRLESKSLCSEWSPTLEILSKDEMERREIERERVLRRLRRDASRFASDHSTNYNNTSNNANIIPTTYNRMNVIQNNIYNTNDSINASYTSYSGIDHPVASAYSPYLANYSNHYTNLSPHPMTTATSGGIFTPSASSNYFYSPSGINSGLGVGLGIDSTLNPLNNYSMTNGELPYNDYSEIEHGRKRRRRTTASYVSNSNINLGSPGGTIGTPSYWDREADNTRSYSGTPSRW